ncbi:MAG: UPF0164 family protein [Spirochaetaceae bacterium]|jgi:hypothetical protein|nr:UPF0164 family protein [Spirochaetaceae bacterium]
MKVFSRSGAVLAFFFSPLLFAGAADWDASGYGNLSDFLQDIYGIDNNAGLTAFPVLNVPMGGRSAALSGAFSAVANDISYIEWNPAGSATLEQTGLAFFHNNWIADTKIEAAAFATRFGNLGLGLAGKWLWTPFTEYGDFGEHLSKGYYSEAVASVNISYNLFRRYYFEGISLGMNLKAALRSVPDFAGEAESVVSGSGKGQSAVAFMGDVGFLTRINLFKPYVGNDKNTAFALVFRNYGSDVSGDPLPTALVAAVSYKPLRPVTLSFDAAFPLHITDFYNVDFRLSEKPSFSFGVSGIITQFLQAHFGFTLKSGGIRIAAGTEININSMNFYLNYTLDLLTQLQPLNRVTIGVRFDMGDRGRSEKRDKAEQFYLEGLQAYNEGRDDDARAAWEDALSIDKYFQPASEALIVLDNFEALEKRINDMVTGLD